MFKRSFLNFSSEDGSGVDISPREINTPTPVFDPDATTTNELNEISDSINKVDAITDSINESEIIAEAIDSIKEVIKPTTDEEGITPYEAEAVEVAVESLLKIIGYRSNRIIPAMESFGGNLSKVEATRLAIESLEETNDEISKKAESVTLHLFESVIDTSKKIEYTRSKLKRVLSEVEANAKAFYSSDEYNKVATSAGSPLTGGGYTEHLISDTDVLDGKIPSTAVLNNVKQMINTLSTSYKLKELNAFSAKLGLVANVNVEEVNSDTLAEFKSHLVELSTEISNFIIDDAPVSNDESYSSGIIKTVKFPLSGRLITFTCYNITSGNDEWYGYSEIKKENYSKDIKLSAMSAEDSNALTEAVLLALEDNSFMGAYNSVINNAISYTTSYQVLNKKFKVTHPELVRDIGIVVRSIDDIGVAMLQLFSKHAEVELRIYNAVIDYVRDSVTFLKNQKPQ